MKKHLFNITGLFFLLHLTLSTPVQAQDFVWKNGTNMVNLAGIYGTIGTPALSNTPGGRRDAASWHDNAGNFWLFGGYGYDNVGSFDNLNDLWKFNPVTREWAWMGGSNTVNQFGVYGQLGVFAAGNRPGARRDASSWTDATGNLWLFGGRGYDVAGTYGELNDMWMYDIALGQWKWVKGSTTVSQAGTYGLLTTPSSGNTPGARYGAVSWHDNAGNFWMFGGYGISASPGLGYLADLWRYNPTTNVWTWMKGSNGLNTFGTYGTQGTPAAANVPGARTTASGWTDLNGNLWIIGGYGYSTAGLADLLSDLWMYDMTSGQWTWFKGYNNNSVQQGAYGVQGTPAFGNLPGARYSAITWTDGLGDLWLFSGFGFDSGNLPDFLNDLWRYNIGTNSWTWVKGANTTIQPGIYGIPNIPSPFNIPGARGSAVSWKDGSNNLWLFGGTGYDAGANSGDLNDIWKFFNCISPTVTINSTTTTACAGISTTLTGTGANTYTWAGSQTTNSIVVTPLGTSDYSVMGTDKYECTGSGTFTLNILNPPTLTTTVESALICAGESATVNVSGAATYTWNTGDTGPTATVITNTTTTFTVTGVDNNGCFNTTTITQSVAACTGIEEAGLSNNSILVYPNPSHGEFTVKLNGQSAATLILFNALGQKVLEQELGTEETLMNSGLSKGVYLYQLKGTGQEQKNGKIVIE